MTDGSYGKPNPVWKGHEYNWSSEDVPSDGSQASQGRPEVSVSRPASFRSDVAHNQADVNQTRVGGSGGESRATPSRKSLKERTARSTESARAAGPSRSHHTPTSSPVTAGTNIPSSHRSSGQGQGQSGLSHGMKLKVACDSCSVRHRKCFGGNPCKECTETDSDCIFSPQRSFGGRRKTKRTTHKRGRPFR